MGQGCILGHHVFGFPIDHGFHQNGICKCIRLYVRFVAFDKRQDLNVVIVLNGHDNEFIDPLLHCIDVGNKLNHGILVGQHDILVKIFTQQLQCHFVLLLDGIGVGPVQFIKQIPITGYQTRIRFLHDFVFRFHEFIRIYVGQFSIKRGKFRNVLHLFSIAF